MLPFRVTQELVAVQDITAWGDSTNLTQPTAAHQMLQALNHAGLLSEEQERLMSEQPFHNPRNRQTRLPPLVKLEGNGAKAAAGELDIDRDFVATIKVMFGKVACALPTGFPTCL